MNTISTIIVKTSSIITKLMGPSISKKLPAKIGNSNSPIAAFIIKNDVKLAIWSINKKIFFII